MQLTSKTAKLLQNSLHDYKTTTDEKVLSFVNGKLYAINEIKDELKEIINSMYLNPFQKMVRTRVILDEIEQVQDGK